VSLKVALIGSGNILFRDEGIGVYAAKYLKENYIFSPPLEIIDGGGLGFSLISVLLDYDSVIILNASSERETNAGTVFVQTQEEFLDSLSLKKTVNELEIAQMLQACSLGQKSAQAHFVSMVPEDIFSTEVGVSRSIQESWERYLCAIIKQIESCGIEIEQKEKSLTLDEVVRLF